MPAPGQPRSFGLLQQGRSARGGDRPFLTWYDAAGGGRIELSYATFANWVSKVANLLTIEAGLEAGDRVGLALGTHWLAAVTAFSCWRAGLCVVPAAPGEPLAQDCAAVVVGPERLEAAVAPVVVAAGSGPFGRVEAPLAGALDLAGLAPSMPDDFDAEDPGPEQPALAVDGVVLTASNVLARAGGLAAWAGLRPGDRLASLLGPHTAGGLVAGLLVPFTAGAGVVLQRGQDGGTLSRLAAENVVLALLDPAQLETLTASGAPAPASTRLESLVVPGPLAPPVAVAAEERLGVAVLSGWGSPATAGPASLLPRDLDAPARGSLRGGPRGLAIGCALGGSELAVVGPDGRDVPDGVPGELCAGGEAVAAPAGGRLRTGEQALATTGPDGRRHLFLTGGCAGR